MIGAPVGRILLAFLLLASFLVPPPVAAQEAPPELAQVVVEDSLLAPGMVPIGSCPTGRVGSEQTGEGVLLKVRGKCNDASTVAVYQSLIPNLTFTDGEIRLEFKIMSGVERVGVGLFARADQNPGTAYWFGWNVGGRSATIGKNASGASTNLAQRANLSGLFRPADWNSIALRIQGTKLWLLLNEQPILSADDSAHNTGGVWLRLFRTGNPDDEQEISMLVRNLRVSALAGSEPARTPAYGSSSAAACTYPLESGGRWKEFSARLELEEPDVGPPGPGGRPRLCLFYFPSEDVYTVALTGINDAEQFRAAKAEAIGRLRAREFDACRISQWAAWGAPNQTGYATDSIRPEG